MVENNVSKARPAPLELNYVLSNVPPDLQHKEGSFKESDSEYCPATPNIVEIQSNTIKTLKRKLPFKRPAAPATLGDAAVPDSNSPDSDCHDPHEPPAATKAEDAKLSRLATLGCSNCRYSKNGCGKCRKRLNPGACD